MKIMIREVMLLLICGRLFVCVCRAMKKRRKIDEHSRRLQEIGDMQDRLETAVAAEQAALRHADELERAAEQLRLEAQVRLQRIHG